ncbi:MAG: NAD(P)/FAD-dependent oxidoreductase [Chlorobiaceae bacterium]
MEKYDVIVIGGGLGGLTAGAKLAKEGREVLLIEQHTVPGGCATTFRRKDFLVEAGLHEMDGLDSEDPKMEIFNDLEVFRHLKFVEVPELYRFKKGSTDIVIPAKTDEAIAVLVRNYPHEEKGIRKFFRTIQAIRREVSRQPLETWKQRLQMPIFPLLYPHLVVATNKSAALLFPLFAILHPNLLFGDHSTIGNYVDGIIGDEELKLLLLANFGYYHDNPYELSLVYYSMAQASYYSGGGHFIKGGSQQLSDYLAGYISSHGGKVMLGTLVTRIVTEEGRATGVVCRKTRGRASQEEQTLYGDIIVGNAAIPNIEAMLPERERALLQKKTANLKPSCCVMNLYLGFKREVSSLNNRAYVTFVYNEEARTLRDVVASLQGDITRRGFTFVDYSQIDSGLAPKGKSFGSLCTIDYLSDWEGLAEEAYHQKKEMVAQAFIKRLEKLIPGISEEIEYYELGTAKTVERYTLNPGGAIYGYGQLPEQSGPFNRPSNRSPVKNLYFASAWSQPGGGFTGAMLSGWFCAREILGSKA